MELFALIGLLTCIFAAPKILRGDFNINETGGKSSGNNRSSVKSVSRQQVSKQSLEDYGLSPKGRI
jgi:hypothetical protein